MKELIVQDDPSKRPSMYEVVSRYEVIYNGLLEVMVADKVGGRGFLVGHIPRRYSLESICSALDYGAFP
jgi:hypothetical protein